MSCILETQINTYFHLSVNFVWHNVSFDIVCSCQPFPHFLSVLQLQTLGRLSVRAPNWRNEYIIHRWRYGACFIASALHLCFLQRLLLEVHQLPNLPKVLLGMVPKSLSSNRNQQGRLCWVLSWSYACVLTSLAVSIMLYCPLLAKNVCMSTFLVQWPLRVQCCLRWLGSVWPSLGFKGNWFW